MVEQVQKPNINEFLVRFEQEELDDVDIERLLKEWTKSFCFYSLNPEDFKFKFSDL